MILGTEGVVETTNLCSFSVRGFFFISPRSTSWHSGVSCFLGDLRFWRGRVPLMESLNNQLIHVYAECCIYEANDAQPRIRGCRWKGADAEV